MEILRLQGKKWQLIEVFYKEFGLSYKNKWKPFGLISFSEKNHFNYPLRK